MKRKLAAAFLALCAIGFAAFADEYEDGPTVFAPGHILTNSLDALPFSSPRLFSLPPSPIVDTPPDSPATSTNFVGGENTIFTPPDTMGAVGPNHVMTMINGRVKIQNKAGGLVLNTNLNGWWNSVGPFSDNPTNFVFDPHVTYDPFNNRWIATAVANADSPSSLLLLAASAGSNPNGTWHRFSFVVDPFGQEWLDFPLIGFNKDKVVITGTYWNPTFGPDGTLIGIFSITNLYAGGTWTYGSTWNSSILGNYNIAPVRTYDTNESALYMVQTWNSNLNGQGRLAVWSVGGTVASPTIVSNSSPAGIPWTATGYTDAQQNFARQLGTAQRVDTGDDRMVDPVYRFGSIWTAHTIWLPTNGSPTHSAIQWWQVNPTNGATLQRGLIEDTTTKTNYAYSSIAVNKFKDVLVGYSLFSSNIYPSAGYSFRDCTDAAGSMQAPSILKAGTGPFWKTNNFAGNTDVRNRWGDYSGTAVDPANDTDLWTIQEYATNILGTLTNGSGRWGTWWGRISPVLPANDHFTNSFLISGTQGSTNGTNVRATRESGEPNHNGNSDSPSVWYHWVAPATGSVSFEVSNRTTVVTLILAVYTGSAVGSLTSVVSTNGTQPRVIFTATSNTTYRIAVAGQNGSCAAFTLRYLQATPPTFQEQPVGTNVVANVNENATLRSLAIGIPNPTYQWKFYGTNSSPTTNNISGATNATYTITNVQTNHAGNYFVVASNSAGTASSDVATIFVHGDSAARLNLISYNTTSFWFQIYGLTNRAYRVETTTNLNPPVTWTRVFTNNVSYFYTNFARTNDMMRFYRAITNN